MYSQFSVGVVSVYLFAINYASDIVLYLSRVHLVEADDDGM